MKFLIIFWNLSRKKTLPGRKLKLVLNGQTSSWNRVLSVVLQELVSRLLLFSVYIKDLPDLSAIYLQNVFGWHVPAFKLSIFWNTWTRTRRISYYYSKVNGKWTITLIPQNKLLRVFFSQNCNNNSKPFSFYQNYVKIFKSSNVASI